MRAKGVQYDLGCKWVKAVSLDYG